MLLSNKSEVVEVFFMLFYPCVRDISPFGGTSSFLRTPAFKLFLFSGVQVCSFVPLPSSFFSFRGYKLVSFVPLPLSFFSSRGYKVCSVVPLPTSFFSFQGYKLVSSYPCLQAFSHLGGSSILSNCELRGRGLWGIILDH